MFPVSLATKTSRRSFLRKSIIYSAAAVAASVTPAHAIPLAPSSIKPREERNLRLINTNTWEKLDVVYWVEGQYNDESLQQINHLMRDHHVDKTSRIDPHLLDFLYRLYARAGASNQIHILSAYRTRQTNATLRKTNSWVSKRSLHMKGRAVDIFIPGLHANTLQRVARKLVAGGVGYYPSSGFVHLDTGYARHWQYG